MLKTMPDEVEAEEKVKSKTNETQKPNKRRKTPAASYPRKSTAFLRCGGGKISARKKDRGLDGIVGEKCAGSFLVEILQRFQTGVADLPGMSSLPLGAKRSGHI